MVAYFHKAVRLLIEMPQILLGHNFLKLFITWVCHVLDRFDQNELFKLSWTKT